MAGASSSAGNLPIFIMNVVCWENNHVSRRVNREYIHQDGSKANHFARSGRMTRISGDGGNARNP